METDKRIAGLQKEEIDKAYKNLDGQQETQLWDNPKLSKQTKMSPYSRRGNCQISVANHKTWITIQIV